MSVTPATPDTDIRATPPRAPTQESRHSPEAKFQDAVDSRRLERARAAAKDEHARGSQDGVAEAEGSSDVSDANRSESGEPSKVESPEESPSSTRGERLEPHGSNATRSPESEPAVTSDDAAPPGALRVSKDASPIGSAARSEKPASTELAIPLFGQAALEAVLAGALHPDSIADSSRVPAGTPPSDVPSLNGANALSHGTPRTAAPAEQPAAKASTTIASTNAVLGIELLELADRAGAPKQTAGRSESPTRAPITATDPRGALATFATTGTADVAAARAPVTERLTPAELPAFLQRLAVRIDAPERSAVVHLEPAELGRLSIALSVEPGGHVRAEMHAQRPDGYAALEARLPELQASLIERGFASATLNLSLGQADSQARQSRAQSESRNTSSAGRRTLSDTEVRALSPASAGAIDLWA